jgi:hypothetical protein
MKKVGEFIRNTLQVIVFVPAIVVLIFIGLLAWILGVKEEDWYE